MSEANKIREVIPDLQTKINGCHNSIAEIEYKLNRLGTSLHGHKSEPDDPSAEKPTFTAIQQLEHDINSLMNRLEKANEYFSSHLRELLGEE